MSEPTSSLETHPGDDLLADLADDFLRRYRAGENPSVDEYANKYPEMAQRIRELFPAVVVMEQPNAGPTFDFTPTAERVGAIIGRYKLLERIGEGGFGVVYMAEQQQPVRRKVALKVIKPGIDTRQVIARFEAERQALALMDHENIAKVLDAGATESGRPYFVMELVHGVPITEFCDKNKLSTRERLELFVQVCRAVQHAHTKGLIHRDLKPTNMLVTLHEGVPVPKVIDFGVAKATGQQLTDKTLFTNFAQMVGTPLYMSPEQAEMTGIDVDTRSDVYSLGVLLYELLTGTTPLDKDRLKQAAFDEVRRIIREDELQWPSARLSTMGQQAARSISAYRNSDPKQLGQLVRGELDWIVMKALEKERARRYETASALAADVQRYLRDEPVEACPPSAWYRFRKFARRRKATLAAAAGIALMLLVGAGMLAISNVRVSGSLERERRGAYFQRIALAEREWAANNLSGMEELLRQCPEDLCGWEWHYLKRLRYGTLPPLRHESGVYNVTFSPDGQYMATATKDGFVRLWHAKTGQELRKWPAHETNAPCVRFSPDGRRLASASWDRTVKVWDVQNVLQGEVQAPLFRLEHTDPAFRLWSVAFSPDGQRLVSAGGRESAEMGELKVWDLNTGNATITLGFSWVVRSVQFSPNGRRIVGCSDDMVKVWDAQSGREEVICRDPHGDLQAVTFSPDGGRIAAVGGLFAVHPDREIKVWDAQSGHEVFSLRGHVGGLRSVAFSPDGRRLASTGLDQTIKLWDTLTGQEILTLRGHIDHVFCVAFSPDGRQLASASLDSSVRIWDATEVEREPSPEYRTLRGHTGAVTDVAFHPTDERTLASAGTDGTVRIWDFSSGQTLGTLTGSPSDIRLRLAYSPDGRRLAVASGDRKEVSIWDVATAKEISKFPGNATALCVAFNPDGQHVASSGTEFVVRVWDAATGNETQALTGHEWPVHGVAFSPDGRRLASCSADTTVRIWDWTTGQELRVLEPRHTARVQNVAFSRDGKFLASAGWDRTVKVWETATWQLVHNLRDSSGAAAQCVAFGRDGRRLAWGSADGTVKVWDGPGTETHVLRGHISWVQAVAFSPDDKWIASASLDGTVKIWKAPAELKAQIVDGEVHRN
jgi:WD40 repeat protein